VEDRQYAGGAFDWLTPFSLMVGVALVAGYALLGSTWLIMKTEDQLQDWAYRATRPLLFAVVGFIALISTWVPFLDAEIRDRWFSWPNIAFLSPVPLLVAAIAIALHRALQRRYAYQPFLLAMVLFLLNYGGLAISIWPNIIPPYISIWEAASPPETQVFLLVGFVFLIPVVLANTAYSYWIFRGKITQDVGYH
jgi:cytochrome d ubiquinol oxidase subunit II